MERPHSQQAARREPGTGAIAVPEEEGGPRRTGEPPAPASRRSATLDHPALARSLKTAYSAEKAASFAYIGHAASLNDPEEKAAVRRIEQDEWDHRANVLEIMRRYGISPSRWLELRYHVIGTFIGLACHVIGRFMPFFFAGRLESGNVCEYFVMIRYFHELGITEHDQVLYEMGIKEKEHEVYFLTKIQDARWLPWFERVFSWGSHHSSNDVDLDDRRPVETSDLYCRNFRSKGPGRER